MSEYKPREGDKVSVTYTGTICHVANDGTFRLKGNALNHGTWGTSVATPYSGLTLIERPERFEIGAYYLDADDELFMRRSNTSQPWRNDVGMFYSEDYPSRPLRKLVPESADG